MKLKLFVCLTIIMVAAILRFWNYEGRTTYGWDQTRDINVLEQSLSTHKLPLLGPIVRGESGGFYLGPLYHYLVQPIYALTSHNPLSLVWTSIILDVVVALGLAVWVSPMAGVIWAVSSLLINSSLTPWNVSLIHPWVLAVLLLARRLNPHNIILFLLLLSTATSIHLTLIPLAFVILLVTTPTLIRATHRSLHYLFYLLALLLPQIPLIISDLKTNGSNLRAFKDYLFVKSNEVPDSLFEFIQALASKIGYTTSRLFVGEPYLILGCLIFVALIIYAFIHSRTNLLIIITLILSLLFYRDPNFAEYYLNAMLVPLVILASLAISSWPRPLTYLAILAILGLNLNSLDFRTGPYSMRTKKDLLSSTLPYIKDGVELRLLLPESQQFGFAYYLKKLNINNQSSNRLKLYIAGSELDHIPAPPEAQSVIYQTSLAGFRLVVFSN